jgi:apolipoprotein N-acyltransferase
VSVRRRRALLAGYALATFFSFPHFVAGRVLDLGVALAWLGPALLVAGLSGLAPRRAALAAFAAGWLAHAGILHWIYVVTVHYGHAVPPLGVLAVLGLAAWIAVFFGLFGAGLAALGRRGLAGPFAAALLWTVLEHARTYALGGFPWAQVGYAQHRNPALVALAAWTGVQGLGFVTVLGGAALAALAGLAPGGRRRAAAALGLVAAAHLPGVAGWGPPAPAGPPLRVAVLQGNIDQGVKWSPAWADRTLGVYEELTRRAAGEGARVIVFPETAVPGSIDADAALSARLVALAQETGASLVIGAVGLEPEQGGGGWRYYDSAFLLDADGRWLTRYDKSHLVPFGEYVPLRQVLGLFLRALARGMAPDNVTAGSGPRALRLAADGVPVGVPICYELIFPDLVRRFVHDGAGVLFGITNDAWYGRTGAPYQFLAMTALRSAENRVFTARAANTGVSAIIDHRGRVREQTPIFERGYLVSDVPVRGPSEPRTFYSRHGDVFTWVCWAALAVGAGRAVHARRKKERT